MNLIFKDLTGTKNPPAPGEVQIRLEAKYAARLAEGLASLVLENGLAVLTRGTGIPATVVVNSGDLGAVLDDMLAATFAKLLLEGRPVPAGCRAFAKYAAVARQGFRPTTLPPEDTLEGIFAACRNAASVGGRDPDLTDAAVAARFQSDWAKLEAAILEAAGQNVDPFSQPMFAGRAEFAQERAFIISDYETYLTDVARGEKWIVRIPGGPPVASGLVLQVPRSLQFKHWARTDRHAPVGGHYLFMAVNWGGGKWFFSTNPAQRLSIAGLAHELNKAEPGATWSDGADFNHTAVAHPRGGTALSDKQVLAVVKKWARARRVLPAPRWLKAAGAAVLILLLAVAVFFALRGPGAPITPHAIVDGKQVPLVTFPAAKGARPAFTFQLHEPMGTSWDFDLRLPDAYAHEHEGKLKVQLTGKGSAPPAADLEIRYNDEPQKLTRAGPNEFLSESYLPFHRQRARVSIRLKQPSDTHLWATASWMPATDLYVVAVGVSQYADKELNLSFAVEDAEQLARTLQKQEGRIFRKVHAKVLTNHKATRREIFRALEWVRDQASSFDMVFLSFSGHGADVNQRFSFLPHDYDRSAKAASVVSSVDLLDTLSSLAPYTKMLVLDTCYSGKALEGIHIPASSQDGLWVLAASTGEAEVLKEWNHGALTRALLDVLQKKTAETKVEVITARFLTNEAYERIRVLRQSLRKDSVIFLTPPNSESWEVPVAVREPEKVR